MFTPLELACQVGVAVGASLICDFAFPAPQHPALALSCLKHLSQTLDSFSQKLFLRVCGSAGHSQCMRTLYVRSLFFSIACLAVQLLCVCFCSALVCPLSFRPSCCMLCRFAKCSSVCLFVVCLYVCLPVCPCICLSICLSVCPSVCQSVCLFVCLSVSLSLFRLFVCLY